MAARPNPLRTITETKRLAENQQIRLRDAITNVETYIAQNTALSSQELSQYKQYISLATKQFKSLAHLISVPLPEITLLNVAAPAVPATVAAPAPAPALGPDGQPVRRRGRPPKNPQAIPVVQAAPVAPAPEAPAPKKRGRPRKVVDTAAVPAPVAVAAPVATVVGVPAAPRKRGRPPKNPQAAQAPQFATPQVAAAQAPAKRVPAAGPAAQHSPAVMAAINTAPISDAAPVKRGPGRPKGSKNKPKVVNGQNEANIQQ